MYKSFCVCYFTTVFSSFVLYVTGQSNPPNTSGTPLNGNATPAFSGRPPPTDSIHFRLRGLCRDGWTEGSISISDQIDLPICLKINHNSLDWNSAQETCRQDNGFLLKLETPVKVRNEDLLEYLDGKGVTSIWTGLHEERRHLVWDSLAPYLVKPLNSITDMSSSKRPWHWGIIIPDDTSKVCGMLALNEQTSNSKDNRKRKRRAPDDEGDNYANPSSPDVESTGIAESLLSNLESSPSQVEHFRRQLESSGLGGLQSAQKILPGSGSSVQNTQHGGISRNVGFLPQNMFQKVLRTITTTPSDSESDISAEKITGSVLSEIIDKAKDLSLLPEDHSRREPAHIDTGSILDRLSDVFSSKTNMDTPDDNGLSHSHPSPLPTDTKGVLDRHSEVGTSDIDSGKKEERVVSVVSSTLVPDTKSILDKLRIISPLSGKSDDHDIPKQSPPRASDTTSTLYKPSDPKPPTTDINMPSAGVKVNPTKPVLPSDTKSNSDKASESLASNTDKSNLDISRTANGNNSFAVHQMKDILPASFKSKQNDSSSDVKQTGVVGGITNLTKESISPDSQADVSEGKILSHPAPTSATDLSSILGRKTDKSSSELEPNESKQIQTIDAIKNNSTDNLNGSSANVLSATQGRNEMLNQRQDSDKTAGKDDVDKNKQSIISIQGIHNEFISSIKTTDPVTTTANKHSTTALPDTRDPPANDEKLLLDSKNDDHSSRETSSENFNSDKYDAVDKADDTIRDVVVGIKDKINETLEKRNENVKVADDKTTLTVSTTTNPQQIAMQGSNMKEDGNVLNNGQDKIENSVEDKDKTGSVVTNTVLDKIGDTNKDDKLDNIKESARDDGVSKVDVPNDKGDEVSDAAVQEKANSMEEINGMIKDKVLDAKDSIANVKESVVPSKSKFDVEKEGRESSTEISVNKNTNYTNELYSEEEDMRKNGTARDFMSDREIRGGLDDSFDEDAEMDSDGALDQDSFDLSEEAQLQNQFRKQERQDAMAPDQLEPDKDNLDDTDLSEVLQPDSQKVPLRHAMIQRIMKLASCQIRLPSVCFSYQIEVPASASSCEQGWYGHVLFDRCYKIMETKVNLDRAKAVCNSLNATVFKGETNFHREFVLLAVHRTGNFFRGTKFWLESPGCRYFDEQEIQDTNCKRSLNFICEKPSLSSGKLQETIPNNTPEPRKFSIALSSNTLQCGLTPSNSELPTLWFKDGILVSAKMNRSSNVIGGNSDYEGISATADDTRSLSLDPVSGAENISKLHESAQGTYWCEVWDANPLRLRRSQPYFITYTDVISIYGSLKHPSFSPQEVILFNKMNQMTGTLTSIEADLLKIFKDFLSTLHASSPPVVDISVHIDRISPASGLIEVHAYLRTSQNYSLQEQSVILEEVKRQLSAAVNNAYYMSTLPGGTAASVLKTIKLRSTVFCPRTAFRTTTVEDTNDDSDEDDNIETTEHGDDSHTFESVHFPWTHGGQTAFSEEKCDRAGKVPSSQATCVGDFYTGFRWTNITHWTTCKDIVEESDETEEHDKDTEDIWESSPYTERLAKMSEIIVSDTNVEEVVKEIAEMAEQAEKFAPIDIDHIADMLEKATELDVITQKAGGNVLKTMDKLMANSFKEAEIKANVKSKASNRIIKSLERYAEKVDMGKEKNIRMVTDNVAVEIWKLEPEDSPIIGLACQTVDQLNDVPFKNERISTIYNESQIFEADVDAAIELPQEIFTKRSKDGKRLSNRLYMMVFRKNKLFEAAATVQDTDIAAFNEKHVALLDSYIISASIAGQTLTNLKEKVKTVFKPLKNIDEARKCVFWDFNKNDGKGGWSTAGCHYEGRVQGRDICMCDHLTNFAVLLDFYGQHDPIPGEHELSLSIISVIGLSFSILGLSLTIISYAFFRKLRKGRAQQTLFNLALALLLAMLVFLTGVKQTHNYYGCLAVAVSLHYLILVSFMWMLMSAILQYLTFVKVLGTYVTRFTLKTVLPAWGLPLIPVISVLCIDYTLYRGGPDYCWMALPAFYYGFSIPISLIIVVNVIIFCITIISISRRKAGLRSNQSKQKMAVTNLQAAIASFILLGLTWMFGYLAIADARLAFQYIFTILNSMQGFFIFILFVVRKKKVREQWYIVCCKGKEEEKASRTLSASNSVPSTYSNRSSRTERSSSTSSKLTTSFTNHGYESFYDQPYTRRTSYNNI